MLVNAIGIVLLIGKQNGANLCKYANKTIQFCGMALLQAIERAVRISKKGLPSLTKAARPKGAPQIAFQIFFVLNQHNNQRDYRSDCRHNSQHGNATANVPSARPAVRPSVRSARSAGRGRRILWPARPHRPSRSTRPSRSSRPPSARRRCPETSSSHKFPPCLAARRNHRGYRLNLYILYQPRRPLSNLLQKLCLSPAFWRAFRRPRI